MNKKQIQEKVEEAILDFSIGEDESAERKLRELLDKAPDCYDGWLALTEVQLACGALDEALAAAENALAINPEDIHVHTSLSRIWVEKGDKDQAEHHGAQARILGWKDELKKDPPQS